MTRQARQVAIVNETLASHFWPNQSAIGRSLVVRGERVEVVGVVPKREVPVHLGIARGMVYRPMAQSAAGRATLLVRSRRDPAGLMAEIQRVFREVDPAVRVFDVRTMGEHLVSEGGGFLAFELGAMLTGVFGAAGVLLAAIGLYGMIAGRVTQRTQEFGVRIALGADRACHPARCARPCTAAGLDRHRRRCACWRHSRRRGFHAVARRQPVRSADLWRGLGRCSSACVCWRRSFPPGEPRESIPSSRCGRSDTPGRANQKTTSMVSICDHRFRIQVPGQEVVWNCSSRI